MSRAMSGSLKLVGILGALSLYVALNVSCNDVGRPDSTGIEETVDDPEPVDSTDATDASDTSDVTDPSDGSDVTDASDSSDTTDPDVSALTLTLVSPGNRSSFELGDIIVAELEVEGGDGNFSDFVISAVSNIDGPLGSSAAAASTAIAMTPTTPGFHYVTFRLMEGNQVLDEATLEFGLCGWLMVDDFNAGVDTSQWITQNDAYWDNRGWIEMTGNATGKKGAIFGTGSIVSATNAHLRFKIATGQCDTIGSCGSTSCSADGFALSVYPVDSSDAVSAILDLAQSGGGLGYNIPDTACGTSSECAENFECRDGLCVIDSFHIEFDTWENAYDPTWQNHMGIMVNADAGNHVFYQNIPSMEDNFWHTIEVTINGTQVSVKFDDLEPLGGEIPEFQFKGGSIAFTGSTGACTNYHRFDDLEIEPACRYTD